MEHRPQAARKYLDIVVDSRKKRSAIELKFKTRRLEVTVNGEPFWLANHGAQDCGKYDVIKDIERLEQVVDGEQFHEGFMIFLTNDPHYFVGREEGRITIDQQFRLTQGRILNGELKWSEAAGSGTTKRREEPIWLTGQYELNWMAYSKVDVPFGEFRMIIVKVNPIEREDRSSVDHTLSTDSPDQEIITLVGENTASPFFSRIQSSDPADIVETLSKLAIQRPIFRSQFDLQGALARTIEIARLEGFDE